MPLNQILEKKTLAQVVREVREPEFFLVDLFFWNVKTFNTRIVEIDVVRDDREIAAFTHPEAEPNVRQRTEWERQTHTPPYIFESVPLKVSDLFYARPGEDPYASETLVNRLVEQIVEDTRYLEALVKRTMEWMASILLDGGAITITGKGFESFTIDFKMPAGNIVVLTGGDRWSQTTSSPLKDFRFMQDQISQESGMNPNVAIFGNEAWEQFLAHAEVQAYLDSRRANLLAIDPTILPRGVRHVGEIEGTDCFVYNEKFKKGGTLQRFIKTKRIYFGSTDAQTMRAHGAIQNFNALGPAEFFLGDSEDQRGRVKFLDIETAVLLALSQASAFGYLVVDTEP